MTAATENTDATTKLEAALPPMLEAAYQLEARGYTLAEIADAFLLMATSLGTCVAGERASAEVLARVAERVAASGGLGAARIAH